MRLPLRLSIQSKLLLMLIGVSLLSIAVTGWLGYRNAKTALSERVSEQLKAQRIARTTQLQSYFQHLRSETLGFAENPLFLEAVKALAEGFRGLESASIKAEQTQALTRFYQEQFLPRIAAVSEGQPIVEQFMPTGAAARLLQYHYIAANRYDVGNKAALDFADDASAYSAAHARYHPLLARMARRFALHDLMLLDPHGNIVYSVAKEIDFGGNVNSGLLSTTNMARAFRYARDAHQRNFSKLVDFERYTPSYTAPASFLAAPIYEDKELAGVVIVQMPTEPIQAVVSGRNNWAAEGLGKTGEVYLVGSDFRMRSKTRFLTENPEQYYKTLASIGVPARQLDRIKEFKTSLLEQEVGSEFARRALLGQSGELFGTDYRQQNVFGSYGPAPFGDLAWGIVVKMDEVEAFAPVNDLRRKILISAVGLQLLITLAALALAHLFLRPIERLVEGTKAIGEGKLDTVVQVASRDEFHDLAGAFNVMTAKLKEQTQKTETTLKQNEALLLNILPGPVAKRLKDGEQQIADAVPSVTVMFASLLGFDELTKQHSADAIGGLLNELIGAFDETAERLGVEKVKTVGAAYLAVAGLNIPAIDHPTRTLEFAQELVHIVERFNQRHDSALRLRAGVNTGPVMAGVVGRSKFIYDLWGDTVSIAQALEHLSAPNAVLVTASTYERVKDSYRFERTPDAHVAGKGALATYQLSDSPQG